MGVLKAALVGAGVILATAAVTGFAADDAEESFLRVPQGPYRGTVLDAKTNTPVPDAVIVIAWLRADDQVKGLRHLTAVQETLTDGAGRFLLDVETIETRLPPRTFAPRLVIYKPGYAAFPAEARRPLGVPAQRFAGGGSIVRLTPADTAGSRIEAFNAVFMSLSQVNLTTDEAPLAWDLLKSEAAHFGYERPRDPVVEDHRYLGGKTFGPYVGQVVDAETRTPVEGAAVVASWWRHRVGLGGGVAQPYAAREVLTDRDGRFVIDATELEERSPHLTMRPTFTFFSPGSEAFSPALGAVFRNEGFVEGRFPPHGVVVGLPRMTTLAARSQHVRDLDPYRLSKSPFEELPHFMRLINQERASVGLGPYRPQE